MNSCDTVNCSWITTVSSNTNKDSHLQVISVISDEYILSKINEIQFRILTPSFILVLLLMIIGVLGNSIALMVYVTQMKQSPSSLFIITITISDLVNCAFGLPVELYLIFHFWTFDFPWLCKITRFLNASMNNVSALILTALAVERFRTICLIFKPRISYFAAKTACLALSFTGVLLAIPMFMGYGTYTKAIKTGNGTVNGKTCSINDKWIHTSYPEIVFYFNFIGFAIVSVILVALYSCIARRLLSMRNLEHCNYGLSNPFRRRQSSSASTSSSSVSFQSRPTINNIALQDTDSMLAPNNPPTHSTAIRLDSSKYYFIRTSVKTVQSKRLSLMLLLVTFVFEISFIPFYVIWYVRNQDPGMYERISVREKIAYQFFLRCYLINSAVNPVIYCFCNRVFRQGVKRLFRSFKKSISENVWVSSMI